MKKEKEEIKKKHLEELEDLYLEYSLDEVDDVYIMEREKLLRRQEQELLSVKEKESGYAFFKRDGTFGPGGKRLTMA